jgi:protein TonB
MASSPPVGTIPTMPFVSRNVAIAGGVVLLHVGALWALQSGLLRRAVEVIVPVEILSQIVTPPAPKEIAPPPPAPQPPQPAVAKPVPRPTPRPAPQPVAAPNLPPAPNAPSGVVEPQPAPAPITAPVAVAPAPAAAPPAPPAPPRIELPSSAADYLQNPQPPYPPMSKRLGEQGQVMLRVLIGAEGSAQQVELRRSSGFDRLDTVALETVRRWRFVPGKRNGVPEAMWFNVPINFVLE